MAAPREYMRSTDGARMVEVAPYQFVSAVYAKPLGLAAAKPPAPKPTRPA